MHNPERDLVSEQRAAVLRRRLRCAKGSFGCGCLVPLVMFFVVGILTNDTGGPLFWPAVSLVGMVIGGIVGFQIAARREP